MNDPQSPLRQASNFPGNLLRRCHQISVAIFLNKGKPLQVTQLQYIGLAALEERGPLDQSRLGGLTALDRNTTAVVVKKLEARGLVTRERNAQDRRSMLVTLSAQGRDLRRRAEVVAVDTQDELMAPLSAAERETLRGLLQKIADQNNGLSRVPVIK